MRYDFIAIGDMVTDAFIKIKEASIHCKVNKEDCEICLKFADKVPYEEVYEIPAVGNSANAAFSAARLGLKSALASNIGGDRWGKDCLDVMKKEGVGTKFIKIHKEHKTNYHYVLWYEDDRTILVKHEDYTYELPDIGTPKWIYLSSVGAAGEGLHDWVIDHMTTNPGTKLAFQPGTFQMKLGVERLKRVYENSEIFFCNKEESQRILKNDTHDIKELLKGIRALGPKIAVITDGPLGAYGADDAGMFFMPPYPDPKPPYERTGAGDAFSSTVTAALALGVPFREAMRWGPVNSMSVVQYVGAREGLLNQEKLLDLLKKAPADYQIKPI